MNPLESSNSSNHKRSILKKRAKILARPLEDKTIKNQTFEIITFKLGEEIYGIEIEYVKEFYPLKDYTTLPSAPSFLFGLANVRRRVIPIIDLKILLSLTSEKKLSHELLIIEDEHAEIAILIDAFSGIQYITNEELQTQLPTFTGLKLNLLKGVILDGTVILDGKKLLSSPYLSIDSNIT